MANETSLVLTIQANTAKAVSGMERFVRSLKETAQGSGQAERALSQTRQQMARYVAQVQQVAAQQTRSMQAVAQSTERSMAHARKALQSLAPTAEKSFSAVRLAALGAKVAISGMLGPLGTALNVGRAVGAVFGGTVVAGLGAIGKTGVDMIATLRGAENTLTSILGNRGAASQFVKALEQEAAQSLPTFKDLLPAATQLAQVYGPQGLGKVIPTIRAFGDAATVAAGGDTEALSRALAQFRQLVTRDNPTMEDLGLIGENLGVNVRDIIKQTFGTADMEALGKAGVTGMMLGDALVAGFQKKFGGAQKTGATGSIGGLMSGISDAFNSVSAQVSSGLYESIMKTLKGFLDFISGIQKSEAGQAALKTIEVLLNGVGRALELAVKQAQPFLDWLSKVATSENVVLFLANVLALLQTIGDRVLKLFGVDLKAAMDPKNAVAWFEALGQATAGAINTVFGLGRVFGEVGRIIKSALQDVGDYFEDLVAEMTYLFKTMVYGLQQSFNQFAADLLGAIAKVMDGLREVNILGNRPFKDINTSGIKSARQGFVDSAVRSWHGTNDAKMDLEEYTRFAEDRRAGRMAEDPFRNTDPGKRFADAFAGAGRDTSAQDAFWADFARSRTAIAKGLFAGALAPAPTSPTGAGVQLFGATPRGAGSVTSRALGIPSPLGIPVMPQAPAMPSGDPFAPVRLPDGRVVSQFDAAAQGMGGAGVQVQQGTGANGARSVTLNFYPQNFQQMKQMVLQWIDEEERKSNPGPSLGFP